MKQFFFFFYVFIYVLDMPLSTSDFKNFFLLFLYKFSFPSFYSQLLFIIWALCDSSNACSWHSHTSSDPFNLFKCFFDINKQKQNLSVYIIKKKKKTDYYILYVTKRGKCPRYRKVIDRIDIFRIYLRYYAEVYSTIYSSIKNIYIYLPI